MAHQVVLVRGDVLEVEVIAPQVLEQLISHRVVLDVEQDAGEGEERVSAVRPHTRHQLQVFELPFTRKPK